jgi:hypothetical protein
MLPPAGMVLVSLSRGQSIGGSVISERRKTKAVEVNDDNKYSAVRPCFLCGESFVGCGVASGDDVIQAHYGIWGLHFLHRLVHVVV